MSQCDGSGKIKHQVPEYGEFVDQPGSRIPIGMITWEDDCVGCPRCRPCSECGGTGIEDDHGLKLSCYDCRGTGIEP